MLNGYIYEAHFECHGILMLGKSLIKWRQRPDMTIAVDWDVKHQFKRRLLRLASGIDRHCGHIESSTDIHVIIKNW